MQPKWKQMIGTGRYIAFFSLFALFIVQDKLQDHITLFQYFDEGVALLFVPLLCWHLIRGSRMFNLTRENVLFFVSLAVFFSCGWAGHVLNGYQPLSAALKDAYVNMKFFLAAGAGYLLFYDGRSNRNRELEEKGTAFPFGELKRRLFPVLYGVSFLFFVLSILDAVFHIFSNDTRGGLPAVKLFYSAQTNLVGICVLLCAMLLWYWGEDRTASANPLIQNNRVLRYLRSLGVVVPLVLLSAVMFSTLRAKSVGAIACIILVCLFVLRRREKPSRMMKIFFFAVLAFAAAAGIYQVFRYYYQMGMESARAVLTVAAPFVAWDHFPFGCGWATFGSAFSGEPYSPVYGMYRMSGVWGLSPGWHQFVSDTYWPMVLAETGYFGLAALLCALCMFARKIWRLRVHPASFASALLPFLYLFISSTSESAFANPLAVPMAFWIGFLFAEYAASPVLAAQTCANAHKCANATKTSRI